MTADTTQHVIATLFQSRIAEETAQRLRADAAKLYRGLTPAERSEVAKASGFSSQTLELLAASSR